MSKARVNTLGGVITEVRQYEQEGSDRAALVTVMTMDGFTEKWVSLDEIEIV